MPYFEDEDNEAPTIEPPTPEPPAKAPEPKATEPAYDIAARLAALDAERERILSAGKNEIKALLVRLAQLCKYHGHLKKADFPDGIFATRKRRATADAVVAKKKPGRKPKVEKQS